MEGECSGMRGEMDDMASRVMVFQEENGKLRSDNNLLNSEKSGVVGELADLREKTDRLQLENHGLSSSKSDIEERSVKIHIRHCAVVFVYLYSIMESWCSSIHVTLCVLCHYIIIYV